MFESGGGSKIKRIKTELNAARRFHPVRRVFAFKGILLDSEALDSSAEYARNPSEDAGNGEQTAFGKD